MVVGVGAALPGDLGFALRIGVFWGPAKCKSVRRTTTSCTADGACRFSWHMSDRANKRSHDHQHQNKRLAPVARTMTPSCNLRVVPPLQMRWACTCGPAMTMSVHLAPAPLVPRQGERGHAGRLPTDKQGRPSTIVEGRVVNAQHAWMARTALNTDGEVRDPLLPAQLNQAR